MTEDVPRTCEVGDGSAPEMDATQDVALLGRPSQPPKLPRSDGDTDVQAPRALIAGTGTMQGSDCPGDGTSARPSSSETSPANCSIRSRASLWHLGDKLLESLGHSVRMSSPEDASLSPAPVDWSAVASSRASIASSSQCEQPAPRRRPLSPRQLQAQQAIASALIPVAASSTARVSRRSAPDISGLSLGWQSSSSVGDDCRSNLQDEIGSSPFKFAPRSNKACEYDVADAHLSWALPGSEASDLPTTAASCDMQDATSRVGDAEHTDGDSVFSDEVAMGLHKQYPMENCHEQAV